MCFGLLQCWTRFMLSLLIVAIHHSMDLFNGYSLLFLDFLFLFLWINHHIYWGFHIKITSPQNQKKKNNINNWRENSSKYISIFLCVFFLLSHSLFNFATSQLHESLCLLTFIWFMPTASKRFVLFTRFMFVCSPTLSLSLV